MYRSQHKLLHRSQRTIQMQCVVSIKGSATPAWRLGLSLTSKTLEWLCSTPGCIHRTASSAHAARCRRWCAEQIPCRGARIVCLFCDFQPTPEQTLSVFRNPVWPKPFDVVCLLSLCNSGKDPRHLQETCFAQVSRCCLFILCLSTPGKTLGIPRKPVWPKRLPMLGGWIQVPLALSWPVANRRCS